ncbi:hypothetical protein [Luteibaculum oceani]|uniref:Outer membrane beta-barrel protein n=1 Tax=Luteibaculum oceani TaxID=1294296 RepID=A0A5C6URM4_9FLAO|nr:hypothetical protein [Luteibaculum oceani]TXC75244.1 hypothetical protein FRX97_12035 [Luteibaculum oceani]
MTYVLATGPGLDFEFAYKGDKSLISKMSMGGGFSYFLPISSEEKLTAYPYSSWDEPQDVVFTETHTAYAFSVFGKYYFFGNYVDSKIASYIKATVDYQIVKTKLSTQDQDFDRNTHRILRDEEDGAGGPTLGLGIGLEARITPNILLFGEANGFLPANEVNDQAIQVNIGAGTILAAGARFAFDTGGRSSGSKSRRRKGFGQSKAYKAARAKSSGNRKPTKSRTPKSRKPAHRSYRYN